MYYFEKVAIGQTLSRAKRNKIKDSNKVFFNFFLDSFKFYLHCSEF